VILEALLILGVAVIGDHAILGVREVLGDKFLESLFVLGATILGASGILETVEFLGSYYIVTSTI
jgi:hypothetical protein